jgi:NADPH2:quinone reductase
MKAIQIEKHGGPEVMSYTDVPEPSPGPGEVLVKLAAAGVNFIDTYQRTGLYPVKLPRILGLEGAGSVEAVGDGVTSFKAGDRVAYTNVPFSYAEKVVVPADTLLKVPDDVDSPTAAAALLQGMTAHYLSESTYPIAKGDTVLIHAAAGGVGLLLVQMAKRRGARVLGTVSTEEKAALAREAGADLAINYTEEDFVEVVKRETDGRGLPVVYDSVGQSTFMKSLDCLRLRGMLVSFGQSSGKIPEFDPATLGQKGSLYLTRPSLFHYVANREDLERRGSDVFSWIASGKLDVRVGTKLPLSEARKAHELLEGRQTTGKVILECE